jgi:rubrerythrin
MKTKGNWVIKTSAGLYWCSGNFDHQIRKAHIYTWKEKAEEMIETMIKKKYLPAEITYEVVAIAEPKELKDTKAHWELVFMPEEYNCSVCGGFALHKSDGTEVLSKFCPHCGKYMTNHAQDVEDDAAKEDDN